MSRNQRWDFENCELVYFIYFSIVSPPHSSELQLLRHILIVVDVILILFVSLQHCLLAIYSLTWLFPMIWWYLWCFSHSIRVLLLSDIFTFSSRFLRFVYLNTILSFTLRQTTRYNWRPPNLHLQVYQLWSEWRAEARREQQKDLEQADQANAAAKLLCVVCTFLTGDTPYCTVKVAANSGIFCS